MSEFLSNFLFAAQNKYIVTCGSDGSVHYLNDRMSLLCIFTRLYAEQKVGYCMFIERDQQTRVGFLTSHRSLSY